MEVSTAVLPDHGRAQRPTAVVISDTCRPSLITANTALYRCSATLISFMKKSVKDQPKSLSTITRNTVTHQAKPKCQPSGDFIQRCAWGSRGLNPGPTDYESAALTG